MPSSPEIQNRSAMHAHMRTRTLTDMLSIRRHFVTVPCGTRESTSESCGFENARVIVAPFLLGRHHLGTHTAYIQVTFCDTNVRKTMF